MPLTNDDRQALADMAQRADADDREALTRLAGDPEPPTPPGTAQTARVRELLAQVAERTGIK